jgi:hypothetical protein
MARRRSSSRRRSRGRKPKLGSGARFKRLTRSLAGRKNVRNPKAVAAAIGRKKYGKKRMAKMSAAGRRRKARRRR